MGNVMMDNIIISCDQSLSGCLGHQCGGDDPKAPSFPYPLRMAARVSLATLPEVTISDSIIMYLSGRLCSGDLMLEASLRIGLLILLTEELVRPTNNYHEKSILGERRFGKVYKGILPEEVVVIKETKLVHEAYVEKFIKRVIQLSQINHKNLVKLLGCCLETKVPLLVYEFVNDGSTLVQHFHHEGPKSSLSKESSLKIATDIAHALAYMHSGTSTPMVHGNVNLLNILLDDNNVAKLDCEVPYFNNVVDKDKRMTAPTTAYLDPEYFLSEKQLKRLMFIALELFSKSY
ncbi:hypothetical protein FNV43_RR06556 [Rhamnella rubrinervis]|uniref:Protein kinase domain-containing protein n=1 Tax=Rhamnella rubrinervis TaxID=2594499 RepID=A0A8K0MLW5_9ROSA|nr:hypothetical protein FNV43_RR06556 [Rhamnella rubrinervis]